MKTPTERIEALERELAAERERHRHTRESARATQGRLEQGIAQRDAAARAAEETRRREAQQAVTNVVRPAEGAVFRRMHRVADEFPVAIEVGDVPGGALVAIRIRANSGGVATQALRLAALAFVDQPELADPRRGPWDVVAAPVDIDAAHALAEAAAARLGLPFDPDRALEAGVLLDLAARLRHLETAPARRGKVA